MSFVKVGASAAALRNSLGIGVAVAALLVATAVPS